MLLCELAMQLRKCKGFQFLNRSWIYQEQASVKSSMEFQIQLYPTDRSERSDGFAYVCLTQTFSLDLTQWYLLIRFIA